MTNLHKAAARVLLSDPENTLTVAQIAIVLDMHRKEVADISREIGKQNEKVAVALEAYLAKAKTRWTDK